MTQSRKRQVNFRGFFQSISRCAGLVLALGARQVDDVKFADLDVSLAIFIDLRALNSDGEDGVRATGMLVHVSGANMAICRAFIEHFQHVVWSLNHEGREVLYVDTGVFVFEFKLLLFLRHEIADLLLVNFQVRNSNQVLAVCVGLNLLEDVLERTRHDTFQGGVFGNTTYGESFACACLPIGKDRSVVALDHILTNGVGRLSEHISLFAVPIVN